MKTITASGSAAVATEAGLYVEVQAVLHADHLGPRMAAARVSRCGKQSGHPAAAHARRGPTAADTDAAAAPPSESMSAYWVLSRSRCTRCAEAENDAKHSQKKGTAA